MAIWTVLRFYSGIPNLYTNILTPAKWVTWLDHTFNQSNPLFCALRHQCRFGCYSLFSAESGLLFVKLFKAWQDLRGLVYWETVWSEGLTAILGLSLIACVAGLEWCPEQTMLNFTLRERESVYWRTGREVYNTATEKRTAETKSISTRWLIPCFSFSPSSTHRMSSRGALQSALNPEDYNQACCFLRVNIWPWKIFPVSVFLLIVRVCSLSCWYSLKASTSSVCMLYGTRGSGSSEKKLFIAPATVFTDMSFSIRSMLGSIKYRKRERIQLDLNGSLWVTAASQAICNIKLLNYSLKIKKGSAP